MEQRRRQSCVRATDSQRIAEVLHLARATRGDHWHAHRIRNRAGHIQRKAVAHAVGVHGGQQNLACAALHTVDGPFHCVQARVDASAVDVHVPAAFVLTGFDVHRQHDALAAELHRALRDKIGVAHRRAVDAHLVRAQAENLADLINLADAAAHSEGNEHLLGHAADHVQHGGATLMGRVDVQEDKLVRAGLVVADGGFHRVARIADVHKVDALDHSSVADIKAGNDTLGQHAEPPFHSANRLSIFSPASPDFSG